MLLAYHANTFRNQFIASVTIALSWLVVQVFSANFYVSPNSSSDSSNCGSQLAPCNSIGYALTRASAIGDTLILEPGVYKGSLNTNITFPGKNVNITSTGGSGSTFIDGEGNNQIFNFTTNETGWVDGLTILSGTANSGGCGIMTGGATVNFMNSVFLNCRAANNPNRITFGNLDPESGGSLYIKDCSPSFRNVTFIQNSAKSSGGALFLDNANATIYDSQFDRQVSESSAGAIFVTSRTSIIIRNTVIQNCYSRFGGAAYFSGLGVHSLRNVTFHNNTATSGGALFLDGSVEIDGLFIYATNSSVTSNGGAISLSALSTMRCTSCQFVHNSAKGTAGAIYAEAKSQLSIVNSEVRDNVAPAGGGGIFGHGASIINITSSSVTRNNGLYGGALLFETQAQAFIKELSCTYNNSTLEGGCLKLQNDVIVTMSNSFIAYNIAGTDGGGAQSDQSGSLLSSNDIFQGNVARGIGGGIYLTSSSSVTLRRATLRQNSAKEGGAVGTSIQSNLILNASTLVDNQADLGGAVYCSSSSGLLGTNGPTFLRNKANFGGVIYFDSSSHNNVLDSGSVISNSAKAGAAFFYKVPKRVLDYAPTVIFSENSALYGEIDATRAVRIESTTIEESYSPKDRFSIKLKLYDYFDNLVRHTSSPVNAFLVGSEGLNVVSSLLKQVFEDGTVEFDNVIVSGILGTQKELYITNDFVPPLPNLVYPIRIISCGLGYTQIKGTTDNVYLCTQCEPGTYSLVSDEPCKECPMLGGDCEAGGNNIVARAGWWMNPRSLLSLNPEFERCQPNRCLAKSECAENRAGPLCAGCQPGFSEWDGKCRDCEQTNPAWILLPLFFGILCAALLIRFNWVIETGISKTSIFFIQSAFFVIGDKIRGSDFIQSTLRSILVGAGSFDIHYTGCMINLTPLQLIAYNIYPPLAPNIGLIICALSMTIYYKVLKKGSVPLACKWKWIRILQFLFLYAYPVVTRACIQMLSCRSLGNLTVVSSAPMIECGSQEHRPFQIFASFVVVIYTIGLPAGVIATILSSRKYLQEDPDHPLARVFYIPFSGFYWYFEVIFLVRRLILVAIDASVEATPAHKSVAFVIFFYCSSIMVYVCRPFEDFICNRLETYINLTLLLISGVVMGDSMRTNYFDNIDLKQLNTGFLSTAVVVVVILMFFQTKKGNEILRRFISSNSLISISANSISEVVGMVNNHISQVGDSLSVGYNGPKRGSNGSMVGMDQIKKSNPISNQPGKKDSSEPDSNIRSSVKESENTCILPSERPAVQLMSSALKARKKSTISLSSNHPTESKPSIQPGSPIDKARKKSTISLSSNHPTESKTGSPIDKTRKKSTISLSSNYPTESKPGSPIDKATANHATTNFASSSKVRSVESIFFNIDIPISSPIREEPSSVKEETDHTT